MSVVTTSQRPVQLGLRANLPQFLLLVAVNALVGGMIGQERTVLPLLADDVFGVGAYTAGLTFILAFGVVKAITNLAAGALSDRLGRRPVLIAGWLAAVPVPLILIWAPNWTWVVIANALLGLNQGLTWSTTVIMKIDLVGPAQRGMAMGINEAAGYTAVAATALATGLIAEEFGLRTEPFLLGLAFAGLGLGLSTFLVRETHGHALTEARSPEASTTGVAAVPTAKTFRLATVGDPVLSSCSQAGMVNNLNDGMAWGLLPVFFVDTAGLSVGRVGVLAAIYPAVWGLGQLYTGGLSDRIGRKGLIVAGMWVQAAAIGAIAVATSFGMWATALIVLGIGTAMVYPTLLAAVADAAHPSWRGAAVGTYRFWRDAGFAIGAVVTGVAADALGPSSAIVLVAVLTAASGALVAVRMPETRSPGR